MAVEVQKALYDQGEFTTLRFPDGDTFVMSSIGLERVRLSAGAAEPHAFEQTHRANARSFSIRTRVRGNPIGA